MPRRTPLYDRHLAAGAHLVEFAGYEMPLQYTGMRQEHEAVRSRAGLFDLSHMGEVRVTGVGALDAVAGLLANDIHRVDDGRALYSVMCRDDGGIVDDVIVYRDGPDDLTVVVNAGCRDKDVQWIRDQIGKSATVDDQSDAVALLAVQGPRAVEIVERLSPAPLAPLKPFSSTFGVVAGQRARISRTGYTGEDGLELYVDGDAAAPLWDALLSAGQDVGLIAVGLGARDTLRLEAGLRLYGQDMDESVDPFSCDLGWTVRLAGRSFTGSVALAHLEQEGAPRRLIGLGFDGRNIPRHGQTVLWNGSPVGEVTSGTFSFTLNRGIAMASVIPDVARDEVALSVVIRGSEVPAHRLPLPFYRRARSEIVAAQPPTP